MISRTHLEELQAAYVAATPGRWYCHDAVELIAEGSGPLLRSDSGATAWCDRAQDAQFIVLAHRLLPELLQELYALRSAVMERSPQEAR